MVNMEDQAGETQPGLQVGAFAPSIDSLPSRGGGEASVTNSGGAG